MMSEVQEGDVTDGATAASSGERGDLTMSLSLVRAGAWSTRGLDQGRGR